jgi:Yip1 domain
MFQQMVNGSIAVLTRPSVSTFEEHERNSLSWGLIYAAIGAVLSAVLSAIGASVAPPPDPATLEQLEGSPLEGIATSAAEPSIAGAVIGALTIGMLGYLIYLGIVYLIGRQFGGTGQFGELAYDISLFYTPLGVITGIISLLASAVPLLACLTLPISLAAFVYNLYLTYLGIQAGMNVPKDKAMITMAIIAVIGVALFCGLIVLIAAVIGVVAGAAS